MTAVTAVQVKQNSSLVLLSVTDSEREEFVYDLANHFLTNVSRPGIFAMAIDRISDMLLKKSDEELLAIAPSCLITVPKKVKKLRNKAKPTGF